MISLFRLLTLVVLGPLGFLSLRADVHQDLGFTAFANADINTLGSGQVLQARGGLIDFMRGLTTQSLYFIAAPPAEVQDKLAHWKPATHSELKVWLHLPLPPNPTVTDFSGINGLPDNSSVNSMVNATYAYTPGGSALQLDQAEASVVGAAHGQGQTKALVVSIWSQVLAGRVSDYLKGSIGKDDYSSTQGTTQPLSEVRSLLRSDSKVLHEYQGILSGTPVFNQTRSVPTKLYYECFDIEGTASFGTGALYQAPMGQSLQSADIEYYLSSGIYTSVELEQMWPVTLGGRAGTLVWRDDLVSTSNIEYLHGTERLASGMIMLQDVKQAIDAFRSEFR